MLIVQLGANAILAVSLAVCKAGAGVLKTPLYQVSFSFRGRNCRILKFLPTVITCFVTGLLGLKIVTGTFSALFHEIRFP